MNPRSWLLLLPLAAALHAQNTVPLTVDKGQSRVTVAVHAAPDSFVGKLDAYDVSITESPSSGKIATVSFKFSFADLKTGKAERDKEMLRWENATEFPEGVFTLTSLEPAGDNHFKVNGHLRLHGVEREIQFPVAVIGDGHVFSVDGEASIDTREFGLPVIRKYLVFHVDPLVKINFHLQATAAKS